MFTLQYAKNPKYLTEDGNFISLIVKWEEFSEEMPFGAMPTDPEPHGRDLYNRAKAGEFGEVAPYVAPVPTAEENKQKAVRLLNESDWTATSTIVDPAVSNPSLTNQPDFLAYRSALREIAVNPQEGFLTWPTMPQAVWSN